MDPIRNNYIASHNSLSLSYSFSSKDVEDSFNHKINQKIKKFSPLNNKELLLKAGIDLTITEPISLSPLPDLFANALEKEFIKHPNVASFYNIVNDFTETMMIVGHQKYGNLDEILIYPSSDNYSNEDKILSKWHIKQKKHAIKNENKALSRTQKRIVKKATLGPGIGGRASEKITKYKENAFYIKNNYTIRGNIFKVDNIVFPKNLFEIMPRFGYRKNAHVGVRITQFAINTMLSVVGYSFLPVTFGISKVVSDQISTIVTLTGETITYKIAGADIKKIAFHNSLRGLQLELPYSLPVAGKIISIGESVIFGTSAFGIVSSTLADAILDQSSVRYSSKINLDDLGDSSCIGELNNRIDYLSRFLLPYGQYLLLKEDNIINKKNLKKILKDHFDILKDLEKKKVQCLNFYRLSLIAEKIPEDKYDIILMHCNDALPDNRINTNRIAKSCLATLIKNNT